MGSVTNIKIKYVITPSVDNYKGRILIRILVSSLFHQRNKNDIEQQVALPSRCVHVHIFKQSDWICRYDRFAWINQSKMTNCILQLCTIIRSTCGSIIKSLLVLRIGDIVYFRNMHLFL